MKNLDLNSLLKLNLSTKPAAVVLVSQKADICSLVNTRGEEKLYALLQYVVHSDLLLLLLFPILHVFVIRRYKITGKEAQALWYRTDGRRETLVI